MGKVLLRDIHKSVDRKFANGILNDPRNLFRFISYLGYGLYAGKKP